MAVGVEYFTNGFVDREGVVAGFIVTGTAARRFVLMGENMQV